MALNIHVQGRDHQSPATSSISVPGPRARSDAASTGRPVPPGPAQAHDPDTGVLLLCPRPDIAAGPPGQRHLAHRVDAPPTLWCVDRLITRGTEAYLALTRPVPGLVARGQVDRGSFLAPRWDRVGTVGQHVTVAWAELLDPGDGLALDQVGPDLASQLELQEPGSTVDLPPAVGSQLAGLWERWFARHQPAHRTPVWVRPDKPAHAPRAGWWWHRLAVS